MYCLIFVILLISPLFAIQPTVIVHGGAGAVEPERFAGKYKGTILAAQIGYNVLKNGGSPLDAVEAAIRSLEVDPFFNAAYGGALTSEGIVEMDAIMMDGSDGVDGREPLNVGAVTGVTDIMHPITLARRVMEKTEYNFLSEKGAMDLARKEGFTFLPPGTLVTQRALDILEEWRQEQNNMTMKRRVGEGGTVGAVAIDAQGNIAAGTSTGGLTGKLPGRIGDSPLVGSGTYADNKIGGLSATGTGEVIMKSVLTFEILKRYEYLNQPISRAAQEACDEMLARFPPYGDGGVVGLDKDGNIAIGFSSEQMSWAYQSNNQTVHFGLNPGDDFLYDIVECKTRDCIPQPPPTPAS